MSDVDDIARDLTQRGFSIKFYGEETQELPTRVVSTSVLLQGAKLVNSLQALIDDQGGYFHVLGIETEPTYVRVILVPIEKWPSLLPTPPTWKQCRLDLQVPDEILLHRLRELIDSLAAASRGDWHSAAPQTRPPPHTTQLRTVQLLRAIAGDTTLEYQGQQIKIPDKNCVPRPAKSAVQTRVYSGIVTGSDGPDDLIIDSRWLISGGARSGLQVGGKFSAATLRSDRVLKVRTIPISPNQLKLV